MLARQAEFLRALPEEALRLLLAASRVVSLAPGQAIFEDGDRGDSMFVVLTGELAVHKRGRQIAVGGPGEYFGEMAVIEGRRRSAGLRALTASTVLEIPGDTFRTQVAANPAPLLAMLKTMAGRSRNDLGALAASNEQLQQYASAVEHANRDLTEARRQLEDQNVQLERLSTLDTLTGIPNRRRFDESLAHEWRRGSRESSPFSIALCDIDFFKGYNDTYGHQAGDECLARVARALADTFRRPGDLVARYGGEEFVAVLPATGEKGAAALAERMRERVESLRIPHCSSAVSPSVTISIGTATTVPGPGTKPEELIQLADAALYRAKRKGRNRVEVTPAAASNPGTPAPS